MTTSAMGVVVWEWMNDGGRWQAYEPRISDFIESCSGKPQGLVYLGRVDASFGSTTVDLSSMLQLDKGAAGPSRPVRRQIYPADSPAGLGVVWQWSGDRQGEWHRYDFEVADILEAAWSKGSSLVDLRQYPCSLPYIIDLKLMTQVRAETGFVRGVQRLKFSWRYTRKAALGASSSALQHGNSLPVFQSYAAPFSGAVSLKSASFSRLLPQGPTAFSGISIASAAQGQLGPAAALHGQTFVMPAATVSAVSSVILPPSFSAGIANVNGTVASGSRTKGVYPSSISVPSTSMTSKPGSRSRGSSNSSSKRQKTNDHHSSSTVSNEDFTDNPEALLKPYCNRVDQPPTDDCAICCEQLTDASGYDSTGADPLVIELNKCKHQFHQSCVIAMYKSGTKDGSIQCPSCKTIYGVKCGNCPKGVMEHCIISGSLPGYEGYKTIRITYMIGPGVQGSNHPHPGKKYTARGFPRYGFLPDSPLGRKVLSLLIKAWERRLTFTIGTSVTTGESDTVVWNEIHHKTEVSNHSGHGYPDPNYLDNVTAELAVHGISDDS